METKEIKYVYKLNNCMFYKENGSTGVCAKDRMTEDLNEATLYNNNKNVKNKVSPYFANFMLGGEWVKVIVTKTVAFGDL